MFKQTVDAYWPSTANFTATVSSSAQYTVEALPSAGAYLRIVSSDMCDVQIFRMFNTLVDTVPYQEFLHNGTRTVPLPPGKYKVVINKQSSNVDIQIWVALVNFILTEV